MVLDLSHLASGRTEINMSSICTCTCICSVRVLIILIIVNNMGTCTHS